MPGVKVFHGVRKRASKLPGTENILFFHWCGSNLAPGSCSLGCLDGFHFLKVLIVGVEASPDWGMLYQSPCACYMPLEILFAKILCMPAEPMLGERVALCAQGVSTAMLWRAPLSARVPAAVPAATSTTAPKLFHCMACEARANLRWQDRVAGWDS